MIINELACAICIAFCIAGALEGNRRNTVSAVVFFGLMALLFLYQFFVNLHQL